MNSSSDQNATTPEIKNENGLPPRHTYIFMLCAFGCYFITTLILAKFIHAPFIIPTERISLAIGFHYFYPFAVAVSIYLILQLVTEALGTARYKMRDRIYHVCSDAFFLGLFATVMYFHFQIKMWVPLINPETYDTLYMKLDTLILPALSGLTEARNNLNTHYGGINHIYQVGFLGLFALCLWSHSVGTRRFHHQSMCALLIMEMIGAYSYLIAPAVGPFIFEDGVNPLATQAQAGMYEAYQNLRSGGVDWLTANGGNYFTGPPAAMPSLHIAGATIMSWYMIKARSLLAPFILLITLFIFFESILSRWHYIADIPPGLFLAFICITLANFICHDSTKEKIQCFKKIIESKFQKSA